VDDRTWAGRYAHTTALAIHMLVPALPTVVSELGIGEASAQQLVGIYLIGLGLGQLVAGPLADRFGRRPVMLGGLILYIVGALIAAIGTALPVLLSARLVQALGGAAGLVASRVMIGDIFGQREAAGRQATLMAIVTISPALAPVVGGALTDFLGWRSIPGVLCAIAILAFIAAYTKLQETRPATTHGHSSKQLIPGYMRLLKHRHFLLTTIALATSGSSLYLYLAAAPFLLAGAGLSPTLAGSSLFLVAASIVVGTRLLRHAQRRGDAVLYGTLSATVGGALVLVLALCGATSPAALLLPVTLIGFFTPFTMTRVGVALVLSLILGLACAAQCDREASTGDVSLSNDLDRGVAARQVDARPAAGLGTSGRSRTSRRTAYVGRGLPRSTAEGDPQPAI
jgi:MFS transporter, DHA1 family, multidrug resistance protein